MFEIDHNVPYIVIYNTMLEKVNAYQNRGIICIGGDINARCGINQDFIEGADDIPARSIIDHSDNHYGDLFIK